MFRAPRFALLLTTLLVVAAGCNSVDSARHTSASTRSPQPSPSTRPSAGGRAVTIPPRSVPEFAHVVVVVMENHAYDEIIGPNSAPFINSLATAGAVLTQSYGLSHPSQPNYLALFSGSTQGLRNDSCPHTFSGPNLAGSLLSTGRSFVGFSEDLPAAGFTGCSSGAYVRKHAPWADFPALPRAVNQPMTAFPTDYAQLPTVSFVVPNLDHDMHDGTVAEGDQWLRSHLGEYSRWALMHNSLLIVTADEDDKSQDNHIATILTGAHVRPGRYDVHTDHYNLLRTILDSYHLRPFAATTATDSITTIWSSR